MCTIQQHDRHFLWAEFKEVYGVTPQACFVEPFNKFRNHKQKYEAAMQQGLDTIAERQLTKLQLSSRDKPSVDDD